MTSLKYLRKLTAHTRSQWDVTACVLPRCPIDAIDRDDMVKQIGAHLEVIAAAGRSTASLIVKFDMDGSPIRLALNSNDHIIKFPECYWKWWNEIEHIIQRHSLNDDPRCLDYIRSIHKLRRSYALKAIREVINTWKKHSDVPVIDNSPTEGEEAGCHYLFAWSEAGEISFFVN